MTRGGLMGDLIFVLVIVAFFALSAAYVQGCERIVGRNTAAELRGSNGDDDAGALESTPGRGR
jgi:hypothetical protein